MTTASSASRAQRKSEFLLVLIALLFLGGAHLLFLSLHLRFDYSDLTVMTVSGLAFLSTTACVLVLVRTGKRVAHADAIAESQLSHLADFATDLYWETDLEGIVTVGGGRMLKTFSPNPEDVIGRHYLDVIKLEGAEMQKMRSALQAVKPYSDILSVFRDPKGKRYYISLSATPRFNTDGDVIGYLGVGTNVTKRIEAQSRLRHMAEHDMLTGLSNRYAFQNRIDKNVGESEDDNNVALLAIDIDRFKTINDTYGHQVGDALLNLVAKRIKKTIRGNDWAARLGGDEFVVVSRNIPNPVDACLMAARLVTALSRPYQIGEIELNCTASVGVACAPLHAGSSQSLMKCADLALYQAKGDGRSCYRLFETPAGHMPQIN